MGTHIRKAIGIAAVLVLAVFATACAGNSPAPAAGANAGALPETITASGFLEAEEVSVVTERGGLVAEVLVAQAGEVQAGQQVIVLDDGLLIADRLQAEAAVRVAEAYLASLLAGPTQAEVAAADAAIAEAEASLEGAEQAAAQAWGTVSTPHEIDVQIATTQLEITQASTEVANLQAQIDDLLFEIQDIEDIEDDEVLDQTRLDFLRYQVEQLNAQLAAAQAGYDGAVRKLDLLQSQRAYPIIQIAQAHQADSQIGIAEAQLTLAEAQFDTLIADPQPAAVALAEAQVALAQAQVALVDAQIAQLTLTAPVDGVITTRPISVGEMASPGVPLLTIATLDTLKLTVYIPETQIGLIRLSDPVDLAVDAYPGEDFSGTVTLIGSEAEFTPRSIQTEEERVNLVFAVEISIPNPDGRLKPGMPVDAIFDVDN